MKKYEKEEIKSDDTKTINFDDVTKKNKKKKHNPISHKFLIIHKEY